MLRADGLIYLETGISDFLRLLYTAQLWAVEYGAHEAS